ncbi:MAG: metallophosphoesterase family protein [Verrucomicrobia bacterium]|nr:metallophosphoesterase family protein [Verrucomicrobiota bacterium]
MRTIITSDIHLGNRHCRCQSFMAFLDALPASADLVLNGDVVDRYPTVWPDDHQQALERIQAESHRRRLVWVRGNHDIDYRLDDPANIEFVETTTVGNGLFVSHGHDFGVVTPLKPVIYLVFRLIYHVRTWLTGDRVHIADFAKSFPSLYKVMCDSVANKAVRHARQLGQVAATCGHTHHAEDRMIEGIRYINTGSWTNGLPLAIVADSQGLRVVPDATTLDLN